MKGFSRDVYSDVAPQDMWRFPYFHALRVGKTLDYVVEAEKDHYDAFVGGSFSFTPFIIKAARSAVDIPFVTLGETSILLAPLYGYKYGIVTFLDPGMYLDHTEGYGLGGRATRVGFMEGFGEDVLAECFEKPDKMMKSFRKACKQVVDEGAEVIIAGDGVLNEALWNVGVARIYDVPILDCVGAAVKLAESLSDLRRVSNNFVSRRSTYVKPTKERMAAIRRLLGPPA